MEQWFDKEEDVLGIRLESKEYWRSIELPNGIVIDISKNGTITGMEIFNASNIFSGDARQVIDSAKNSTD